MKLYVPLADGMFYILKPGEEERRNAVAPAHPCLGTPALWGGKCFLMTENGLHCFGTKDEAGVDEGELPAEEVGPMAQIQMCR